MKIIILISLIVNFFVISCTSKHRDSSSSSDLKTDWAYGRVLFVDSTVVAQGIIDSITIQTVPSPNQYKFEWIPDVQGTFKIGGLEERKSYKVFVLFGNQDKELASKYIYKEEGVIYLLIEKEVESYLKPLPTEDSAKSGIGNVKKTK